MQRRTVLTSLVLLLAVIVAAPALAHTELASTSPADGATVDAPVDAITLTFDDALLTDGQHTIGLFGPADEQVAVAAVAEVEPGQLTLPLEQGLPTAGQYTVRWIIVADDGDEQRGEFAFLATESATPDAVDDPIAQPDDTSSTPSPEPSQGTDEPSASAPRVVAADDDPADDGTNTPDVLLAVIAALAVLAVGVAVVARR